MVNELSGDAWSITLTVSTFVEMDTPTTRQKAMMDDVGMNAALTFWSLLGGIPGRYIYWLTHVLVGIGRWMH